MSNQILFNEKLGNYTLQDEVDGVKSIKKIPIKFKLEDKTSRFRRDQLKVELEF